MARLKNTVKHRGYTIKLVAGGCRIYAPGARKPLSVTNKTTFSDVDKCKRVVDSEIRGIAQTRAGRGRWYSTGEMRAYVMDRMRHKHLLQK